MHKHSPHIPRSFQFLSDTKQAELITHKWDLEWLRYFSSGREYSFYFLNMNTSNYALALPPNVIRRLNAEQFFSAKLYKDIRGGVFLPGASFVGKRVLEIGCGPGIFGRMASRFTEHYTGIDASLFALSIAKLCSPASNTTYVHLFDMSHLVSLRQSVDTCFGRHFFIHMNYIKALEILGLLKEFLRPGGTISADFHHDADYSQRERRFSARDVESEHSSALYHYEEKDISDLAEKTGLELTQLHAQPTKTLMHATFTL